jgi:hypothetical protein
MPTKTYNDIVKELREIKNILLGDGKEEGICEQVRTLRRFIGLPARFFAGAILVVSLVNAVILLMKTLGG